MDDANQIERCNIIDIVGLLSNMGDRASAESHLCVQYARNIKLTDKSYTED